MRDTENCAAYVSHLTQFSVCTIAKQTDISNAIVHNRRIWLILLGIVLFGFILRVYSLGTPSMWVDESISSLAGEKILEKGTPVLDSGLYYGRALSFHYLIAGFIFLFGGDFGARFVSVLFGVGTIVLVFFIGKEFKSEGKENLVAGLIAALFSAVLFIEVAYSRQARFYQMFQFLFFLTIFLLYKSKEDKKYAWFASIVFIFLVETQIAGLILAPFFFYLFIKENRDWKLFIIPLIVCLYYSPSVLGLGLGGSQTASGYVERYSSSLFYYLRAFAIISLPGALVAFKWNRRMALLLALPSAILLISIFFIKVYALRYAYFVVLLAPIFMAVLLSFIYKNSRIFFAIALAAMLIYPSNLFFSSGELTVIKPQTMQLTTASEPILDYKELNASTKSKIMASENLVLFTPAFSWYFKNPDYFVAFSLNGLVDGYVLYEDKDAYTGARQFNFSKSSAGKFLLIEDAFGYPKLTSEKKAEWNKLKENCGLIEETNSLKILECN